MLCAHKNSFPQVVRTSEMAEDLRKSPQIAKIKLDETVKYNDLNTLGLPWWPSSKEPACHCRRRMLNPWSRRIPHAVEQLSPCAATIEPVLQSLGTATTEATIPRVHAQQRESHHNKKPAHHKEEWPLLAATREKPVQQQRPSTTNK